jgi:nucleoside-diphosphate-sugar epimerase
MSLLVAGAIGALGTPLTRELFKAGHEVIGLSPDSQYTQV